MQRVSKNFYFWFNKYYKNLKNYATRQKRQLAFSEKNRIWMNFLEYFLKSKLRFILDKFDGTPKDFFGICSPPRLLPPSLSIGDWGYEESCCSPSPNPSYCCYVYIHSADNAIWPPNRICEEPGGCAQHSQVVVATLFLLGSLRGHFAFLSVGVTRNLVLLLVMGTAAL